MLKYIVERKGAADWTNFEVANKEHGDKDMR